MENMELFNSNSKKMPAFGIDLGTTNSCISILRDGISPDIIPVDGNQVLPSCVMWEGEDNFIVGKEAYEHRYKANVAYSTKRLMGSEELVELKYKGKKRTFTACEIASKVLEKLVSSANVIYGNVKDVVITVPAYFNDKQVKDTIKAGEMAGLNVLSIIREPTSASLILSEEKDNTNKNFLVYDLGGGTFDVSIINISSEESNDTLDFYGFEDSKDNLNGISYRVLGCYGDTKLGGDDVDNELLKICLDRISKISGIDTKFFPREEVEKIKLFVESAKKANVPLAELPVEFKVCDKNGSVLKEKVLVYPTDIQKAYNIIYNRTKVLINKVLQDSSSIDSIVLVGGSTKSEYLKRFLKRDFPGKRVYDLLNPDESVALGAGYYANKLKFGDEGFKVFDVLPMGIGILASNKIEYIIPKNQSVPCSFVKLFKTSEDFQESVDIEVYQGESKYKEMCTHLGTLNVDVPKEKAGNFVVKVKLECDFNGVLTCYSIIRDKQDKLVLNSITSGSGNIDKILNKKLCTKDKQIIKWTKLADTFSLDNKSRLIDYIEKFSKDEITSKDVVNLIQDIKSNK